ncbi:MAG: pectin acetylesterase-family hydrolase [Candidatus Tectomicrobia bacterium]
MRLTFLSFWVRLGIVAGLFFMPVNSEAETITCNGIHAVRIAMEEGLTDCNADTIDMMSPPNPYIPTGKADKESGRFLPSPYDDDCHDRTADDCANYHYNNPGRTRIKLNDTKDFQIKFINTTTKCSDGTKPHMYIDYGPSGTNQWIIRQNGSSGDCAVGVDHTAPSSSSQVTAIGTACFDAHIDGKAQSGFGQTRYRAQSGIMKDADSNPDFRHWNRVWIPACGNDQYMGTASHMTQLVIETSHGDWHAPIYTHGFDFFNDALTTLANDPGTNDFSDANRVLFWGSSGGAQGYMYTVDDKAAHARSLATNADVRLLLDSRIELNLAGSEARWDASANCASMFDEDDAGCGDVLDNPEQGTDDLGFAFDNSGFLPNLNDGYGRWFEQNANWSLPMDASCTLYHAGNPAPCEDPYHLLYHHTATPVFITGSLADANQFNKPFMHLSASQLANTMCWAESDTDNSIAQQNQIDRYRWQLVSYALYRDTVGGGAHGDSHSSSDIGIWAIDHAMHEVAKGDCEIDGMTLGDGTNERSLSDAVMHWWQGNEVIFIAGYGATISDAGVCVPKTNNATQCSW